MPLYVIALFWIEAKIFFSHQLLLKRPIPFSCVLGSLPSNINFSLTLGSPLATRNCRKFASAIINWRFRSSNLLAEGNFFPLEFKK